MLILLALAAVIPAFSYAAGPDRDRILERAWADDPSGTMSLAEAQTQTYEPFAGAFRGRHRSRVFWIRLQIAAGVPSERQQRMMLVTDAGFVEGLELFDPAGGSEAIPAYFTHRVFVIPSLPEARFVWLRVSSRIPVPIGITAHAEADGTASEVKRTMLTGLSFGATILLLVWSLYQWLAEPEAITRSFFGLQLFLALRELVRSGFLRFVLQDTVSSHALEFLQGLLIGLPLNALIWFLRSLLSEYGPPRAGLRVLGALHLWAPCAIVFLIAGRYDIAWRIGLGSMTFCLLLALFLAAKGTAWDQAGAGHGPVFSRRIICGWLGCMAVACLWGMAAWDWHPYRPAFAPLFTGVFFFSFLRMRAHRIQERYQRSMLLLKLSEQQVEQEKRQRREQQDLLTMLTHELRTPLSVLRMVLGFPEPAADVTAIGMRAITDMDRVIELCAQVDRFCSPPGAVPDGAGPATHCHVGQELEALLAATGCGDVTVAHGERTRLVLPVDPLLVRLILGNLLDNAVKYRAPGTQIEVGVQEAAAGGGLVEIGVRNLPGPCGWPDAARLFQKYYRSPGAHRYTGSGLGLYLSANLARRLGGELRYAPDTQHVEFILCLPA